MVKKQVQPTHDLLFAAAKQCADLMGTEKTMPIDEPDDLAVALGKLNRCNRKSAFETG